MRKLLWIAAVLAVAVACVPATASAQNIILGSSTQQVKFTADGSGGLYIQLGFCSAGTCNLSGTAFGAATSYDFQTTGFTSTSIDATSYDPIGGDWTTVNLGGGTAVNLNLGGVGTFGVTLNDIVADTGKPHVDFDLSFTLGQNVDDFILNNISCTGLKAGVKCLLTNVANPADWSNRDHPATASANVSSGEVFTPEPGTMLLLGTGLVSLGGMLRRRRAKV